jgi:predicted RNA polymerase sigma factor
MLAVLDGWDGDAEGAMGRLREAEALAEERGLPGELWQIRAALGELHEERGETEKAREAFDGAGTIVRELADKMEDSELRSGFLSAPQVRRVLER